MNIIPKTIGVISGLNDVAEFFQLVTSAISSLQSQWNGTEKEKLQGDILQLKSDHQCLSDTLPAMYNLIDRAEWKIHDQCVAELLPKLKDAVYDAEDLQDEFAWHELQVSVESKGNASIVATLSDFFNSVTQGSFNKVTDIQKRLNNLSNQLQAMGFHQETPRFDESLRPETTSFPTEANIFGRDKEIKELIKLLGVPPKSSKRTRSEVVAPTNSRYPSRRKTAKTGHGSSTSNQVCTTFDNNKETMTSVSVLPIVGIGGVGKTTLAQKICSHPQVKSHFDLIIWICVSDDFDVKRLTKEAIEQASRKAPMTDNLNSLQANLADCLNKRRFLMVLDDMWDESGECWKRFYAPFQNVLRQGSMMLVTTRSQKVADIVGKMDLFPLEGMKDDVYWEFFKLCVFGSDSSNMHPELERIGKEIVPKLRGSPLAAKTLGRLLGTNRDTTQWNNILTNELWDHDQEQEGTEILPALRLSYMYLPFHLKRCFSFCAVYPKDHNFEKTSLAEIWVAEGFVPKGNIPLGSQYFEDLIHRSFFQKVRGKYVIHDLIHDMAQLVSKDECYIVKNLSDIEKVPQNVRHLLILPITNVKCSNLSSLGKCTKLRTLLCKKPLSSDTLSSAMDDWFKELSCLRVVFFVSTQKVPESIGNLKHLRYLEISRTCSLRKLPSSFSRLYNLQIFHARKCHFQELPRDINKLINLQKFESQCTQMKVDAADCGEQTRFINKFCKDTRDLTLYNLDGISNDCVVELEVWRMEYLNTLTLRWSSSTCPEHKDTEVLEALQLPPTIKSVHLHGYPGEYLPSWFGGREGPEDINGRVGTIFESLTELRIEGCQKLSSLEQFLQPTYVPTIKEIAIEDCPSLTFIRGSGRFPLLTHLTIGSCKKLEIESITINFCNVLSSVPAERFGSFSSLKHLEIQWCLHLHWQSGMVLPPSLQKLTLYHCGDFSAWFPSCLENLSSLESLVIESCDGIVSIPGNLWSSNLKSLQELKILRCPDLVSIGGPEAIAHINRLYINGCQKLKDIEQPTGEF